MIRGAHVGEKLRACSDDDQINTGRNGNRAGFVVIPTDFEIEFCENVFGKM